MIKFNLIKYIAFVSFFLVAITSTIVSAKLSQSIDRTDIHAGETFILTLQVDHETDEQPDQSLIPKEFTIESISQYQQMRYVNGKGGTTKGWKIKLSTLKTGSITIPSITIGSEKSQPVTLFIKDTSHRVELNGKPNAIYLEADIDTKKLYVQQQAILTVKLHRAVNTHYARLSEPTAGESIIEKLGEDVQYQKTINGTRYSITERRYAIFPQKSGELSVSSVVFTAEVNEPNSGRLNPYLNTTRPISVSSKPILLQVQPQPSKTTYPWVPASEVALANKWSSDSNQLTVGEPITWTILLYAQGLSESQLPEISIPKVDGLQFYPDTAQKERQVNDQGILGQRIEKIAVIPSKEGTITIPEINVKWWDTKSDSEKIASIPAKTFVITKSLADSNSSEPLEMIGPKVESTIATTIVVDPFWKNLAFIFLGLWLLTLFGYLKNRGQSNRTRPTQQLDNNRYDINLKIKQLSESESYKNLMTGMSNNQASVIETNLLTWCSAISGKQFSSLGQLIAKIDNTEIKEILLTLQSFRYANQLGEFSNSLSKNHLKQITIEITRTKTNSSQSEIPALY